MIFNIIQIRKLVNNTIKMGSLLIDTVFELKYNRLISLVILWGKQQHLRASQRRGNVSFGNYFSRMKLGISWELQILQRLIHPVFFHMGMFKTFIFRSKGAACFLKTLISEIEFGMKNNKYSHKEEYKSNTTFPFSEVKNESNYTYGAD